MDRRLVPPGSAGTTGLRLPVPHLRVRAGVHHGRRPPSGNVLVSLTERQLLHDTDSCRHNAVLSRIVRSPLYSFLGPAAEGRTRIHHPAEGHSPDDNH